jgi:nucleotidyltransferase substrate binding protein (TIGR01987 family)
MNTERLREKKEVYRSVVLRLKEALDEDISNPLLYDGVIQRFEFTYELAWKLMKAYLEYEGIAEVNSPRGAFKEAYKAGLIFEGDIWIDMIGDRNLAAHTYNEEMAKAIYNRIKDQYFERFVTFGARMAEVMK